jgi:hypothetical protein
MKRTTCVSAAAESNMLTAAYRPTVPLHEKLKMSLFLPVVRGVELIGV